MYSRLLSVALCSVLWGVLGCGAETTDQHEVTPPDQVDTGETGGEVDTGDPIPEEEIWADCDANPCEAINADLGYGTTAQHMACALDICNPEWLIGANVRPLVPLQGDEYEDDVFQAECKLENMARALTQFGEDGNDLSPQRNDSYVFLANAPITLGHWGDGKCRDCCDTRVEHNPDSFANPEIEGRPKMHDIIEYSLKLKAPQEAGGFKFKFIFMSVEFDDTLAFNIENLREGRGLSWGNDKFYAFVKAPSQNFGERVPITFTDCRWPDLLWSRECGEGDMGCAPGEKLCSISVASAAGEACWFEADDDNLWKTDLTGTGFECAADSGAETNRTGSSTGWLETAWPIKPGEEFELIFHIHDGGDWSGGSAVLIDDFRFTTAPPIGTVPI